MLNNYAESGGGFNSNHGQTSRPAETQKQQNISSTWGYNGQLEGMYYGGEHQPMFMGSYEGSTKHSNYPQYPTGSLHQPVPTPVVKCHEACCQHFQDRYPLNPAPLRYQPSGPVQPRYDGDSRQWRSVQPLSRKKVYSTENGYPGISERHFSQYMGRGQLMADSRQHMQMMRSQYPMYSPYWGGPRGWTGPRMNCPPPPYHQTVSQGAQLQTGLKMSEAHYIDPSTQKTPGSHRRGVTSGGGATDVVRPVPEPKRSTLDPNLQSCYEFGYPTGFVPFSEVNKIQSGSLTSQNNTSNCKIPTDKTYHPHQMQYSLQGSDRNMMNCSSSINELNYPMNFPMPGSDSHIRPGLEDNQQISDARKLPLQYDSSLGKKRPDLDLRQYLATWEDDEDESTRLSESIPLGNSGAPYIVVDCRSLEGDAAAKLQERFKTSTAAQNCASKQRSSSPNSERKTDDQPRQDENTERSNLPPEFQSQTSYASSMPALLSDSEKNVNYWNGSNRDSEGIIGKGGAFQPLDCSKRDSSIDPNNGKRDGHPQNDLSAHKLSSANESGTMSFDALVSYYGDNRRIVDGGYDFVEMTERLVNTSEKPSTNIRTSLDHPIPSEMSRPCDPRLQQSQLGGNPSIYNKVAPRYPTSSYQHYKPMIPADPYYNYKHSMGANKYFGYENSQMIDPTYDYHKMPSDFETARLYGNKEISKDPRRMYHQEIDKSVESAFLDPVRKAQIDCFQDKSLEFGSVDHDQFISPIIMKSTDQHNRDKDYSEKNSSIRDGMNILNNEIPAHSEKTVLITSQNGPPEIFRVPYSPEKDLSHKDNLVTLHSGDQTKSNTITVEVPYDQQYSTLVKLSEEISRSENGDVKSKDKTNSSVSSNELNNEELKKPTSFKLKRLPNSKEWTVEGKEYNEPSKRSVSQNNSVNEENSCDVADDRDVLKSSVTVSSLNMPSLDDIRDGDETCEVNDNHPKSQLSDGILCSNKNVCDDISKTKYNTQTPQMAIVQPMKLTQSEPELIESSSNKLIDKNDKDDAIQQPLSSINSQSPTQLNYNPEKSPVGHSHLDLISDSDISKHENFRTHKKIQNSFSNGLPNCLTSPSEDFLHSSNINPGSTKDSYSPFHVYSDCDMNTQITDYFKIDERTNSGEKMLDTRVPSSPGVDGMFEDINHANQSQLYPQKSCNFQDLTDPNMTSLSAHNAHFQSFSSIFSEDDDKRGRPDGSVLQIGDKKYLKNLLDDIENHHISGCQEEQEDRLQGNSLNEILNEKTDEVKTSPPIPSISLKLNETKKMWCIAKKDKQVNHKTSLETESVLKSNILTHSTQGTVNEFRGVEASSIKNQIDCAYSGFSEIKKTNLNEPPSTSLPRQLQNSDTAEQNLLLDDHRVDKQKLSSTNNISFPGDTATTKMCLTITKYYPRAELFKRITNPASPNLGILVFDENGTHFPKSYDSSGVEVSERVDICQSIITSIFDQTFDFISLRKRNVPNKSSNDSLYHHYKKTNTAISSNQNINEVLFTDTVIKFDSSYSFSKDKKDQVNNIVKTTEVFIQREKENCQHHSVIKTTQLQDYCSKIKTRKTSRSIFSPMSDNGFEDDPIFSKKRKIAGHENIQHEDNINFDILNKDSGHKEKMHDVEDFESHVLDYSSRKSISESTEEPEELSKQLVMNRITDEVFKGFGSPKEVPSQQTFSESLNELTESKKSENSPYHELDKEQNIIKDNLEIDNALELMGLSSTKHLDKANKKYSIECIGKESSVSLQEALENEPDWFSRQDDDYINLPLGACLQRDNVNSDKKDKQVEEENVQCDKNNSSVEITEVKEVCNKSKICQDITKVKEASSVVKTHTNENLIIVSESQEHAEDLCQTTSQRHLPKDTLIGFVNEDVDLTFSQDMDSSYDLPIENHSQTEGIDSLNHPQSYFSPELGATFNKEESLEAWPIVNTGLLSCSTPIIKDSQADPQIEDLEARLETSVIVRNNSCSSFIYNQSDESSITVCQNSIPSQQVVHLEIEQLNTLNDDSKINLRSTENCQQTTSLYLEISQKSTKSNPLNGISEELKSHNNCLQQETYTSKMDCQVENPNDVSKICTESHIENSSTESVANQMPVITSKDMSVSNTINTFKSLGEEDSLMGYCAGESVFMCLDEEVKTYLKRSKLSYFHEFKKRKWQKFFKTVNKKDISNRYIVENKKGNLNNKVYTNEVFDYQSEKVCTKNILPETIVENKETKNSPSPVSVEMDSGIEDESHVQYSDSNLKDKSFHSKCTNNTKETSIQLNCEYQSPKQLMFESVNDSTVEERTSLITNTDKASAPLKDKSQFFIEKDSRVFHTRRDSFKMLEPEFVLKEIFSPDPETDDSESKENECPMNFSQIKYETSPHLMETNLALTTNSISPSLPILSTKFNKLSDCMTSKNPGIEDTLSNTHELDIVKTLDCNDCNTSIHDSGGKNTIQNINDPIEPDYDKQVSTAGLVQDVNQVNATLPLQEEPEMAKKDSDEAGGLTFQIISNTEVSRFTNNPFSSQRDNTLENVSSNVIDQGSTTSTNVINNVENCQNLHLFAQELHNNNNTPVVENMAELSLCQETKACKNKGLKQSTLLEEDTVTFSEKFEKTSTFVENIGERVLQNPKYIAGSIQSTKNIVEFKSSDDSEIDQTCSSKSVPIQQCHGAHSTYSYDDTGLQEKKDKSISLINQDNQTQQITKSSPRQNSLNNEDMFEIDYKENGSGEPMVMSPKGDLTSTKYYKEDQVRNSDINSKNDSKECNVEEQQNTGCHDEKINTVQDSLRNSVNNETFPLQCLVEAALALESVDSKQVMFSNSNFPVLYNQTEDKSLTFSKIPDGTNDSSVKTVQSSYNNNSTRSGESSSNENHLTPTDREIFSKFEETNYNLRASTRIVTSSSSNIIPYSKRKYGLKSSKINTSQGIKQKKTEINVTEKSRTKKRRGAFTYPRSKRRKKVTKNKQKLGQALQQDNFNEVASNIPESNNDVKCTSDVKSLQSNLENVIELNEEVNTSTNLHSVDINKSSLLESNYESVEDISKTDFGGPLIIASSNTSTSGNIFCVHVNSNKMDEYVNNLNLDGLEVLSGNSQALKENSNENSAIVPDVTLENGTSLVIIIEELADTDKSHYIERSKGESDIILSSIEGNCAVPCLNQSVSILDDCSDMLNTEFSVNESCVCPPEFNDNSENPLLTEKQDEILESEQFMANSAFEMSDNIEDGYEKFSANCGQELTANCYEEINENLINDIGNWPFVEEEVAEFDSNTDLLNKIPEEGRKIELKCSLPWKKIFNISKGKKKKSKMSRKVSGLELGPAKVEVRLKAPSAEWKVISDYHENDSPVVKVSRLILQRDSDVSSHSEKDSEEENENKRNSEGLGESETNSNSSHSFERNVPYDENWQPVVILTRNKELDELTLNMELKEHSEKIPSPSNTEDNITATENSEGYSSESASESETNELLNENEHLDLSLSLSRENSSCIENFENASVQLQENSSKYSSFQSGKTNKVQGYETYSPSARNNELTEETLYSPSDPHFSPDTSYRYSDKSCFEDEGDEAGSDGEGDGFITNDSVKSNCSLTDSFKSNDENKRNNNEESILRNDETLGNGEACSRSSSSSDISSPGSSHTNCTFQFASNLPARIDSDSLLLTENSCNNCESNEVTLPNNDLQLNVPNRGGNETEMSELSRDVIIEQKKKLKRKMPKNFFVRKKLIKKNVENAKENSSFIENGTHKSEDEVASDSLLQRLSSDDVTSCSTSDLQKRKGLSSVNSDRVIGSESDLSSVCENSRLQCVYDTEDSSPMRLNESPMSERFEEKVRLRDGGRGLKRPCEGHSKEDTKRRRKKLKNHSSTCEEYGVYFKNKEELIRHNVYRHARRRELHHCLLCQRSFSSAARHSRHIQGRSHRHLELTQRHTMHSMHRLLVGGDCPHIAPLSRAELRTLQWRPTQSGYAHFYHEVTPLQAMLQEHSSDTSEDTMSEGRMPND